MNTQMNLQRISIDKLKPAKYNPRKDSGAVYLFSCLFAATSNIIIGN